jgi:checkpoint serine/threonine-protein kinase
VNHDTMPHLIFTNTGLIGWRLPLCIQTKFQSSNEHLEAHPMREHQQAINPKTGRVERVHVNLEYVYPNPEDPTEEYSFEELRAMHRGLYDWAAIRQKEEQMKQPRKAEVFVDPAPQEKPSKAEVFVDATPQEKPKKAEVFVDPAPQEKPRKAEVYTDPVLQQQSESSSSATQGSENAPRQPRTVPLKGSVDDENANDENMPPSQTERENAKASKKARREERANRTRKIQVMDVKEIRSETQTSMSIAQPLEMFANI